MSSAVVVLLVALTTANAQCFAACTLFSCSNAPGRETPADSSSASSCHHKDPPTEKHQNNTSCSHQLFLGEARSQALSFVSDLGALFPITSSFASIIQDQLPNTVPAQDLSPPPLPDTARTTILRI